MTKTAKRPTDEAQARQAAVAAEQALKAAKLEVLRLEAEHHTAQARVMQFRYVREGAIKQAEADRQQAAREEARKQAIADKADPIAAKIRRLEADVAEVRERFPNYDNSRRLADIAELKRQRMALLATA